MRFIGHDAKLTFGGQTVPVTSVGIDHASGESKSIGQLFGIPTSLVGGSDSTNYSSAKIHAAQFSGQIEFAATAFNDIIWRSFILANYGGWYDGVLHVYSDLLKEWMPIGRHPLKREAGRMTSETTSI